MPVPEWTTTAPLDPVMRLSDPGKGKPTETQPRRRHCPQTNCVPRAPAHEHEEEERRTIEQLHQIRGGADNSHWDLSGRMTLVGLGVGGPTQENKNNTRWDRRKGQDRCHTLPGHLHSGAPQLGSRTMGRKHQHRATSGRHPPNQSLFLARQPDLAVASQLASRLASGQLGRRHPGRAPGQPWPLALGRGG